MKNFNILLFMLFTHISSAYAEKIILGVQHRADIPKNPTSIQGTGLCSSTIKFDSVGEILSFADANKMFFLNETKKITINGIDFSKIAEKTKIINRLDLKSEVNNLSSNGDFLESEIFFDLTDVTFGGKKIITKLKGYLNVLDHAEITIGINTDTAALLSISNIPIVYVDSSTPTNKTTKQVVFTIGGMYPYEIIYYHNNSLSAYLEISGLSGTPTNKDYSPGYTAIDLSKLENSNLIDTNGNKEKMQTYNSFSLFPTLSGENEYNCTLCEKDSNCAIGAKCLDGICQNIKKTCNTSLKCGDSCVQCPYSANFCVKGVCSECENDSQCQFGKICSKDNLCIPEPPQCLEDSDCNFPFLSSLRICNKVKGKCEIKKNECNSDNECGTNKICNQNKKCETIKNYIDCKNDEECSINNYCDLTKRECTPLPVNSCRIDLQCFSGFLCNKENRVCESSMKKEESSTSSNNPVKSSCNYTGAQVNTSIIFASIILLIKKNRKIKI